jgi:hypothetical protein
MPSKSQKNNRIYLSEEEKTILGGLLADWVARPDKKSRDAFISSEVVPLIQQLNMDEYGPEHISKDKVAKELWERRIQVCGHKTCLCEEKSFLFDRPSGFGLKIINRSRTAQSLSWKESSLFGTLLVR